MWIRSQDKLKLKNVTDFSLIEEGTEEIVHYHSADGNPENIQTKNIKTGNWIVCGDFDEVSKYSSKEKAMKVLDMISDAIVSYESSKTEDVGIFTMIFQMPKDEEVSE